MPSPIGHALAGAAIALAGAPAASVQSSERAEDGPSRTGLTGLVALCAALAAAPDLDLAAPYAHRTITHSLVATVTITIIAAVVTGQVTHRNAWRVGLLCGAAYGSHLLLDWLALDDVPPRGLQLLWPFSDRWFISEWDLFRGTARREWWTLHAIRTNALAIAQEVAILGPIVAAIWLVRVKAASRFPAEMAGRDHPSK